MRAHFPEQRLVIEPKDNVNAAKRSEQEKNSQGMGLGKEGAFCHCYLIDNVQEQKDSPNLRSDCKPPKWAQ